MSALRAHGTVSSDSTVTGNLKVAFCMPDLKGASMVALQMEMRLDLVTLWAAGRARVSLGNGGRLGAEKDGLAGEPPRSRETLTAHLSFKVFRLTCAVPPPR